MTESEVLDLKLCAHLLKLMLDDSIAFEKKKGKMDYLVRIGADVNKKVYGKSMAYWVKETNDEKLIKYVKERGGVEAEISKEKSNELGKQFWDKDGKIKSVNEIKELALQGANLGVELSPHYVWDDLSLNEMNNILKDLPKGYVIDGDVVLWCKDLTELPNFENIKINGGFYCQDNLLTSLNGAPREVGGVFDCSDNQLTTLEGAPEKVGGVFDCSDNQLTTLEGAPEKVGGDFDCSDNQLKDLSNAPREVGKDFSCYDNLLISLEGKPLKIGGDFMIEEETLEKIKEIEKQKKDNDVVKGFVADKFEM